MATKTTKKTTAKKSTSKKAPAKKKAAAKGKTNGAKTAAPKPTSKAKPAPASKPAAKTEAAAATLATPARETPQPKAPREKVRDPRLPEPGTVLRKLDRKGNVRCECTVEADGIRYNGTLYRSLSAAAMAAAKDLGLGGKTQNGFSYWGLSKPPRKGVDPVASLDKAWQRYRERLTATLANGISDDNRERVRTLVKQHSEAFAKLHEGAL